MAERGIAVAESSARLVLLPDKLDEDESKTVADQRRSSFSFSEAIRCKDSKHSAALVACIEWVQAFED
jgi:hypothetical protein